MADREQAPKVDTEGSARVLNEVKGRLERMETGDFPVIQRVDADGNVRQVDQTGEMVRPDQAEVQDAAERFAADHRAASARPDASPDPAAAPEHASEPEPPSTPLRAGLWARIKAWFRRS